MDVLVGTALARAGDPIEVELRRELAARGHRVDIVALPVPSSLAERVGVRLTPIDGAHVLLVLRPPAHLLRHPRKVVWLLEEAGDGWELGLGEASLAFAARAGLGLPVLPKPPESSWDEILDRLLP